MGQNEIEQGQNGIEQGQNGIELGQNEILLYLILPHLTAVI